MRSDRKGMAMETEISLAQKQALNSAGITLEKYKAWLNSFMQKKPEPFSPDRKSVFLSVKRSIRDLAGHWRFMDPNPFAKKS
jgi:hypothetical protein